VLVENALSTHQVTNSFLDTSLDQTSSIVASIAPFTAEIQENQSQVLTAFSGQEAGFLQKPSLEETIQSPIIYTVAPGDTISSIAQGHGVSVATILDANNLKVSDIATIKQGTSLTIPAHSTTDSTAWLDELNQIKAQKAEEAKKAQEKAALEKKKNQLALASKRNLPFREASTSRLTDSRSFDGVADASVIVPINHKGISRGLVSGHTGIDYRADVGTPVVAAGNGRVIEVTSGWAGGFGNSVLIDHGGGVTSRYGHLSKPSVSPGDTVSQGSVIGYYGNTVFSTGPLIHFEVKVGGSIKCPFDSSNAHYQDCFVK
jgi:murein DD-endopeptidase MepM/ murein hydrolase activator NlpD